MVNYAIQPQRLSPAATAMIDFFVALGLYRAASDAAGGATFVGRSGRVRVQQAASATGGPTVLTLVTDDRSGTQDTVTSPAGLVIRLEPAEFGGAGDHDLRDQAVASSMDVVAICAIADVEREAEFFRRFGFAAIESGEGYVPLTAGPGSGVIGLRAVDGPSDSPYGPDLGVETSEPFDALAARMQAAGYEATTNEDSSGVWVGVVDPDGQTLEIRPTR